MASLRRRTQAPKPAASKAESRKRSRSNEEEEDYSDLCCEKCGSGRHSAKLLSCDKCDRGFHLFCLRPVLVAVPKGQWFCPSCSKEKNLTNFPLTQTKIVDFFRIQRSSQSTVKPSPDCRKKRKRTCGFAMLKKKSRKLLPFNPTEDPDRKLEQMASLATTLTATGAEFSNELTYIVGMAPRSANCAALERDGMQVLSKDDT